MSYYQRPATALYSHPGYPSYAAKFSTGTSRYVIRQTVHLVSSTLTVHPSCDICGGVILEHTVCWLFDSLTIFRSRSRDRVDSPSSDLRPGLLGAQLCVQNNGRPAAAALTQVVAAAVAAFDAGFHLDRLRLELEHGSQVPQQWLITPTFQLTWPKAARQKLSTRPDIARNHNLMCMIVQCVKHIACSCLQSHASQAAEVNRPDSPQSHGNIAVVLALI